MRPSSPHNCGYLQIDIAVGRLDILSVPSQMNQRLYPYYPHIPPPNPPSPTLCTPRSHRPHCLLDMAERVAPLLRLAPLLAASEERENGSIACLLTAHYAAVPSSSHACGLAVLKNKTKQKKNVLTGV